MPKKQRPQHDKKEGKSKRVVIKNSDDKFEKASRPDRNEDSYYFDEVDEFHASRDKILLDEGAKIHEAEELSEEEVLGLDSSSDEEDDAEIADYEKRLRQLNVNRFKDVNASDISGAEESEDGEDEGRAWGSKRSDFYGADFVEDRGIDFTGDQIDPHLLEEKEAIAMQKRMDQQLDEDDFGLDMFKTSKNVDGDDPFDLQESDTVRIEKDLTSLSKHEKLALLQKESPEMLPLIKDFKEKLQEIHDRFMPIHACIKDGTLGKSSGTEYVEAKVQLVISYCINISFYMMLKAKRDPERNHPVMKRLVQFRNLIQQMKVFDKAMASEVDALLIKIKSGQSLAMRKPKPDVHATNLNRKQDREKTMQLKSKKRKDKKKLSALLDEECDGPIEKRSHSSGAVPKGGRPSKPSGVIPEGGRSWGRKVARDEGRYATSGEKQALEYYDMMRPGKRAKTNAGASEKTGTTRAGKREREETEEREKNVARALKYCYMMRTGKPPPKTKDGASEDTGKNQASSKRKRTADGAWGDTDRAADDGQMGGGVYGQDTDEKRAITYEMAKNKGLLPKRKKEQRNPRVKHRLKYQKALVRRRGQVREVRTEMTRYGGELSGIRAGVIKSTKFKN